ncbi:hypothetical protein P7K49_032273, partial [Saguinus oedipus]
SNVVTLAGYLTITKKETQALDACGSCGVNGVTHVIIEMQSRTTCAPGIWLWVEKAAVIKADPRKSH